MERYDFEVLDGDETVARLQSIVEGANSLWPRIKELASAHSPGCQIRVIDQSGEMVMLVGVTAARRAILLR
jgi:hypothetical protein